MESAVVLEVDFNVAMRQIKAVLKTLKMFEAFGVLKYRSYAAEWEKPENKGGRAQHAPLYFK